MTSISFGYLWTVTILKWSSTCLEMKVSLGIQLSSWFEIWVDKTCGCSDCSWNKPLSRLAFRKKNQNDPNFWTTFGVLSLRQNLRMFSFHRIAAVEIKPLSMVCITQSAQNVLAHLILRTCFSLRVKLGKVPILCINAMYCAHFAEIKASMFLLGKLLLKCLPFLFDFDFNFAISFNCLLPFKKRHFLLKRDFWENFSSAYF